MYVLILDAVLFAILLLWRAGKLFPQKPISGEIWSRQLCLSESELNELQQGRNRQRKWMFGLLLAGISISVVCGILTLVSTTPVTDLIRPASGQGEKVVSLEVQSKDAVGKIRLRLAEKQPSVAEQTEKLEQRLEDLRQEVFGAENSISDDVTLPTSWKKADVLWESLTPEYISSWGRITWDEIPDDGVKAAFRVTLRMDQTEICRDLDFRIQAVKLTELEKLQQEIQQQIEEQSDAEVQLPQEVEGQSVTYYEPGDPMGMQLFLMTCLLFAAGLVLQNRKPEDELKERSVQLEYDYAELILRLNLYLRAGMTIRGAWKRISEDYRMTGQNGPKRYVYEEMLIAENHLRSGVSESEVYVSFGKSCGSLPYMRLGTLLSQHVRKGGKELLLLLEQESQEAFELQKNTAKKSGEEAGTKMLLPMGLLLGVVLVILIVPALAGITF